MNFKDIVATDMDNVFFNATEFATELNIEGENILVVLDDDQMKQRQLRKGMEGVHTEELLFYVQKKSLTFYPRPDNIVRYDDVNWMITECEEDLGMFTITAERMSG